MPITDKQFRETIQRLDAKDEKVGERISELDQQLAKLQGAKEEKRNPLRIWVLV